MTNDIKAEIARTSAEVIQKIRTDSRLSHYVDTDRITSVLMGTDYVRKIGCTKHQSVIVTRRCPDR